VIVPKVHNLRTIRNQRLVDVCRKSHLQHFPTEIPNHQFFVVWSLVDGDALGRQRTPLDGGHSCLTSKQSSRAVHAKAAPQKSLKGFPAFRTVKIKRQCAAEWTSA
jgi:hypothetical protein